MRTLKVILILQLGCWCHPLWATVTTYTNKPAWQGAAGPHTTIAFSEVPPNTNVTTQYQNLGVTFTDGTDISWYFPNLFPNDGFGLNGVWDEITLGFSQPMYSLAVDHPGNVRFYLYWQGQQTYLSPQMGHTGIGWFSGLISTEPFDAAIIFDPYGDVFIDDLHFGPAIPAPGALALLAAAGLFTRRRRRF